MKKVFVYLILFLFGCLILATVAIGARWSEYGDLPAGTIADDDTFLVRDVSDLTLAATGTQKQYSWSVMKVDIASAIDGLIPWDAPPAIGDVTPNTGAFTTLAAGGTGFTVDGDGDVVAKSVTITKVSGVAGLMTVYEANSTDTHRAGFMGAASQGESYVGQFPDNKPDPAAGDYVLMGWPAQSSGAGTTGDPYVHALTAITLNDDATNGATTSLWSADKTFDLLALKAPLADPVFTSSVQLPNAAGPTVDAAGEIAVDTTTDQLQYYGASKRAISPKMTYSIVVASVAATDDYMFVKLPYGITVITLDCIVSAATSATINIVECNATGTCTDEMATADLVCDVDGATTSTIGGAAGAAADAGDWLQLKVESISGTPGTLTVTITYNVVAD